MTRFTGLTALDWAVVFAACGSLALVVQARRPIGGGRALGFSIAPAVTGAVLLAVIAAKFSDTFERLSKSIDRLATLVVLVAALAVAFVVVDFLITRVLPLLRFGKDGPVSTGEKFALFVGRGVLRPDLHWVTPYSRPRVSASVSHAISRCPRRSVEHDLISWP